jgi:hypothetical protein
VKPVKDPPIRLSAIKDPPFGESEPCIMCPLEVRNLAALVHNYLSALDELRKGYGAERLARKERDLRMYMEIIQKHSDAHFADPMHSQGRVP